MAQEANRLTEWDGKRLRTALCWSHLQTVVTARYLVLDTASLFGTFSWSTRVLRSVVVCCLVLFGLCVAAGCAVVSEHRMHGSLKGLALLAGATAPAAFLGFVAFYGGTGGNPTGVVLPLCLGLILVGTWGWASFARSMLEQDTAEPNRRFSRPRKEKLDPSKQTKEEQQERMMECFGRLRVRRENACGAAGLLDVRSRPTTGHVRIVRCSSTAAKPWTPKRAGRPAGASRPSG